MELWVRARADGLVVFDDSLFWSVGCGDQFTPSNSEVSSRPFRGGDAQLHFRPPECKGDRVASATCAVDERNIYWLTGDGRVVALPRRSVDETPSTLCEMKAPPASEWPRPSGIAVIGPNVFWTEFDTVYTVAKTGGQPQVVLPIPLQADLRHLTPLGDQHLLCRSGHRLIRVDLKAVTAEVIAEFVNCFAVGAGRIAWASAVFGAGVTDVWSTLLSGGDVRNHYQTDGRVNARDTAIKAIAIDDRHIYAHEMRDAASGGPIQRIPLSGGPASPMTEHVVGSELPLVLGGGSLFFIDLADGIYRLPTGTTGPGAPGRVWITGSENTQTVQTVDGRIPLIAGKRTFVRMYAQSREDHRGPWSGVTARLTVDGFARSHSPVNSYTITVSPTGSDRRTLVDSFVFELDPEETTVGVRGYTVTLVPPPGRPTDQASWPQQHFSLTFVDGGPARVVRFYGVRYKYHFVPVAVQQDRGLSGPDWGPRAWADFELDRRYAEAYLPVADLQLLHWPGDPTPSFDYRGTGSDEGIVRARAWAERLIAAQRRSDTTKRIVILQPEALAHQGQCQPLAGGRFRINYQTLQGDEGNTLAHELAHSFGLAHTPDLMGYGGGSDARFPRADGSFGSEVALCCEPTVNAVAGTNLDGSAALYDLMSYQHRGQLPGSWTSPYSYCKSMNRTTNGLVNAAGVDGYQP